MALQNIRQSLHRKKDKIIEEIINMTRNKQQLDGHGFSDACMIVIKRKAIKHFCLDTKAHLEKSQKSLFAKTTEKRIIKKRTGGFSHIVIGWIMNM